MNKQFYKSNLASENYLHNTIEYVLNEISNLMKVCYGPYGSHVLIANNLGVEATKDGQKIFSSYHPSSSISSSIQQSLKSVADKQVEEIGDGSTTTLLLLCELYKGFRKIITKSGVSPTVFNDTLKFVIDDILSNIDSYTTKIVDENGNVYDWDTLHDAIYTSVDANKDLTDIIIEMLKEVNSTDPFILVDTSTTDHHRFELVKGVELDGVPICPEVFFNGYSRKNINNPNIIVINGKLDLSVEYIMKIDQQATMSETDYVFLCTGIDDDKLNTLITLKNSNPALLNYITLFQIRHTSNDDEFLDICAAIGANPIDSGSLSKPTSPAALNKMISVNAGKSEKGLVTEFCIRFNNPESNDERVKERIDIIDGKINDLKNDPTSHNDIIKHLENRKAFLNKNYAKLYVGGPSPQRRSINYELAKDGVLQAVSCMKNGVVDGVNTLIPNIISNMSYMTSDDDLANDILYIIGDSYDTLKDIIILNKVGDFSDLLYEIRDNIKNGDLNIRENDEVAVKNSAATDKTILRNATDMAALLATSKSFLSNIAEFDSLNNQ